MGPQARSRRHRTDFPLETQLDRRSFPRVRYNANNFFALQNLAYRHGNGSLGDFGNIREPSLAKLLATAGFIEADNEIGIFCLEVGRRIVKCQMTILSDTHK